MPFSFRFFRFLTYGNLFVVGLMMILIVMAMLMVPSMSQALISLLIMATVLHHNLLCLQLQKGLEFPEEAPQRNFPVLMTVMTVMAFIYSGIILVNMILLASISDAEFQKMALASGGQQAPADVLNAVRSTVVLLFSIHGLAILINCMLSVHYLKKWKSSMEQEEDQQQ